MYLWKLLLYSFSIIVPLASSSITIWWVSESLLGDPRGPGENSLRFLVKWNHPICEQPAPQSDLRLGSKRPEVEEIMNSIIPWSCRYTHLLTFDVPPICTATKIPGWHLQRAQKQRRGLLPPPQTFGWPKCRGKEWRFDLPANQC